MVRYLHWLCLLFNRLFTDTSTESRNCVYDYALLLNNIEYVSNMEYVQT